MPRLPSKIVAGPVSPSAASSAAWAPDRLADPACTRFTSPPDWSYSMVPDASDPAIASAFMVPIASSRSSLATAPAAPNGPWNFIGCQPRLRAALCTCPPPSAIA